MTDQELVNYYCALLLMQYKNLPKANSTIAVFVSMVIMNQLPSQVQLAYSLDTAVGVQLDVIGKYAGVKRTGYVFSGPVTLDDDDFRIIIQMAIAQNNSGSSLADIQNLLHKFFDGTLLIFDYQSMRIDYLFDSTSGSNLLAQFFVRQGSLPKPMGVQMGVLIFAPTTNNFFGFRTYSAPGYKMSSFNSYTDYHMDRPWLSRSDVI
jgi:Protein of unknown function (DUF2612)